MAKRFPQGKVKALERENERTPDYGCADGHIDDAGTENNYHIIYPKGAYMDLLSPYMGYGGKKGPTVYVMSVVVSSDERFFNKLSDVCIRAFFEDATDFFVKRYGMSCVFSAVVHVDEGLPHLHVNFFPYAPGGKLLEIGKMDKNALHEMQEAIYEDVGKAWNLERGNRSSGVETRAREEYLQARIMYRYQQEVLDITSQIEAKRDELYSVEDALEARQKEKFQLSNEIRDMKMEKDSLQQEKKSIMAQVLEYTDYFAGMEMAVTEPNPYSSKDKTIEVLKARNYALNQQIGFERNDHKEALDHFRESETKLRSAAEQYKAKAELADRLMDLFPEEWEELEKKLMVHEERMASSAAVQAQEKTA